LIAEHPAVVELEPAMAAFVQCTAQKTLVEIGHSTVHHVDLIGRLANCYMQIPARRAICKFIPIDPKPIAGALA
jgi:hypothetical protein